VFPFMSHHKINISLSQAIALRVDLDQPADASLT